MWLFKRKPRPRRLEARRGAIAGAASWWGRFRNAGGVGAVLISLFFLAGIIALDVWPVEPLPFRPGQYIPSDIRARLMFKVLSPDQLDEVKDKALNSTPAIFQINTSLLEEISATLSNMPERLKATSQPADIEPALKKQLGEITAESLKLWQAKASPPQRGQFEQQIERLREKLQETIFVRGKEASEQRQRNVNHVWIMGAYGKRLRSIGDVIGLSPEETNRTVREINNLVAHFELTIRNEIRNYLANIFVGDGRGIYRYDAEATDADMTEAVRSVEASPPPEAYESYQAGETLVRGAKQTGLTLPELQLLQKEHESYLAMQQAIEPLLPWQRIAGRAVLLAAAVLLLLIYAAFYQPELVRNHVRALALAAILLLMLALNKVLFYVLAWNPHSAVFTVMMSAIIIAIVFNQRFALAIAFFTAALVVLQMRSGFGLFLVLVAGTATCVFLLRDIRTRSKLIEVATIAASVVFLVTVAKSITAALPWKFTLLDGLWGAGFAMLVGFVVQGILPLIEQVFQVATSMTLLEWCDASKPLLKRLAIQAPGTYNHCLQLGAMCEAAAESIGAMGLLARVGAYYHDIGKINKPEYFVENQAGQPSKHGKLSPAMSLLIILGHVKDGLELAREYNLPPVLHEFITTHHGTTLVQYFYHAATEQRKGDLQRPPEEVEFRYPGPKPRSKEAAILMLADAAESSVRAMSEPTAGRIENQVHAMVSRRLDDGQLDECDLTLKQVHQIEVSLVKSLSSFYHARIAYPTPTGQKPSAAETPRHKETSPASEKTP